MAVLISLGLSEGRSDEPRHGTDGAGDTALFSKMSARAEGELARLRGQITEFEKLKHEAEGSLAYHERDKAQKLGWIEAGVSGLSPHMLDEPLARIEECKRRIATYVEKIEKINGKILEFSEDQEAGLPKRRENQTAIAELALARLRKDEEIEARRQELLKLLAERGEITGEMAATAGALELNCSWGEEAAKALTTALSADFLESSEKWLRWFAGALEGLEGHSPYIVSCETLTLPETLVHNGVYHFGERVWLTEGQAAPLLKETAKEKRQIEPEEDYRQAEEESKGNGIGVWYSLMQRRNARLAAERERKGNFLTGFGLNLTDREQMKRLDYFIKVKAG